MKIFKSKLLFTVLVLFFTTVSLALTTGKSSTENVNDDSINVVINYSIDAEVGYAQKNQEIKEKIKIFVNGESVSSVDDNGVLRLALPSGDYEILAYVSGEYAAKTPVRIKDTELVELDVFLKSEALASIIKHNFRVVGSSENIVKGEVPISLESINSSGERLLISKFSHIRVVRIEPGSFRESIGGKEISRSIFLTNEFEIIDGVLVASKPLSIYEKINRSSSAEYVFDIGAVDLKTGLPLDGFMSVVFTADDL